MVRSGFQIRHEEVSNEVLPYGSKLQWSDSCFGMVRSGFQICHEEASNEVLPYGCNSALLNYGEVPYHVSTTLDGKDIGVDLFLYEMIAAVACAGIYC